MFRSLSAALITQVIPKSFGRLHVTSSSAADYQNGARHEARSESRTINLHKGPLGNDSLQELSNGGHRNMPFLMHGTEIVEIECMISQLGIYVIIATIVREFEYKV